MTKGNIKTEMPLGVKTSLIERVCPNFLKIVDLWCRQLLDLVYSFHIMNITSRQLALIAGSSYIVIFFTAIFGNFFVLEALLNEPLQTVWKVPQN